MKAAHFFPFKQFFTQANAALNNGSKYARLRAINHGRKLRRSELLSGCVFAGGCSFCHAFWYAAFLRRAPSPRARICALGAGRQLVRASPTGGSSLPSSAMRASLATPSPRNQGSLRCSQ